MTTLRCLHVRYLHSPELSDRQLLPYKNPVSQSKVKEITNNFLSRLPERPNPHNTRVLETDGAHVQEQTPAGQQENQKEAQIRY